MSSLHNSLESIVDRLLDMDPPRIEAAQAFIQTVKNNKSKQRLQLLVDRAIFKRDGLQHPIVPMGGAGSDADNRESYGRD